MVWEKMLLEEVVNISADLDLQSSKQGIFVCLI